MRISEIYSCGLFGWAIAVMMTTRDVVRPPCNIVFCPAIILFFMNAFCLHCSCFSFIMQLKYSVCTGFLMVLSVVGRAFWCGHIYCIASTQHSTQITHTHTHTINAHQLNTQFWIICCCSFTFTWHKWWRLIVIIQHDPELRCRAPFRRYY